MRKKVLTGLLLLMVLSFVVSGCGDDGSVTVNTGNNGGTVPTPSANVASITGTVFGINGQPAPNMTITLTPVTGSSVAGSESYGQVQTDTSDTEGDFGFTVSFAGTYLVEAKSGNELIGSQQVSVSLGQVIHILLGQSVTGRLIVQVNPASAQARVAISMLASSSLELTGAQSGEYIFYLPAGTYSANVTAPGYEPVTRDGIALNAGEDRTEVIDLTEIAIGIGSSALKLDPRVVVNANLTTINMTITGTNFSGTATVTLTPVAGGTAITATNVTVVDPNTITCTFDLTGAANGEYTLTLTHTPLAVSDTSATASFWIVANIQDAIDKASDIYVSENYTARVADEISDQIVAFVPAGEYKLGDPGIEAILSDEDALLYMKSGVHLKGAGSGNDPTDPTTDPANPTGSYSEIDAEYNYCVFGFDLGKNMTIEGFRIINGYDERGGAINATFEDYGFAGNLVIKNNTIYNNESDASDDYAGAICIYNYYQTTPENIIISDNVIANNFASEGGYGGGICIYHNPGDSYTVSSGSSCVITRNIIRNNYIYRAGVQAGYGGGIYLEAYYGGNVYNVTENIIEGNGAEYGGGVYYYSDYEGTNGNFTDNVITGNSANDSGGGLYLCNYYSGSVCTVSNNEISDNGYNTLVLGGITYGPVNDGGGVYSDYYVTFENNQITGNHAENWGGGIYSEYGDDRLTGNTITGNEADYGGAVYLEYGPVADITGNTITGNTGNTTCGGIYIETWDTSPFGIHNNTISGNTSAGANGDQLYNNGAPVIDATGNTWGVASPGDGDVFDVGTNVNI